MHPNTPLTITGPHPLTGEIHVQPSKNAALPIIVASLLSAEPVIIHGVPRLTDVETLMRIMEHLGTRFAWIGPHSITAHTPDVLSTTTPHDLVAKLRASITLVGALTARTGEAHVGMPGGCTFSPRPVDQHLKSMRAIGVTVRDEAGVLHAERHAPLKGRYLFDVQTVGGTQNAILAATLGAGSVTLENCSTDTDVVDMVNFLNTLGADIHGAGTSTIVVNGVKRLRGGEYTVIPDRLDAGTFMIAAVASRGHITLHNVITNHLRAVTSKLQEIGATVLETDGRVITVDARNHKLQAANVTATEYPGFPTDLQPIIGALLTTVPGTSILTDRIYSRTSHVSELIRMGANIDMPEHTMVIHGSTLHGANVTAADIRSGGALITAALAAEGETTIHGVQYLNRGYENLTARLTQLGVRVRAETNLPAAMD